MVKKGGQEKRSTLTREAIENCRVTLMNLISSFFRKKVISNQTAYFWTTNISSSVFILIILNYI